MESLPSFQWDGTNVLKDTQFIYPWKLISFQPVSNTPCVKPFFQKNGRLDVGNYRPVSILSVTSKLLEWATFVYMENGV